MESRCILLQNLLRQDSGNSEITTQIDVTPASLIKFDEKTGMPLDDPEDLAHKEWLNILDKMLLFL